MLHALLFDPILILFLTVASTQHVSVVFTSTNSCLLDSLTENGEHVVYDHQPMLVATLESS